MGERITTERVRELLAGATPGPWRISDPDGIAPRVSCLDFPICWVAGDTDGRPWIDEFEPGPGPLADAAIIAAAPDLAADLIAARERIAALEAERDAARELRGVPVEEHARAVREAWVVFCRPLYADRGRAASDADIAEHWRECDTRTRLIARLVGSGLTEAQAVALADGAE